MCLGQIVKHNNNTTKKANINSLARTNKVRYERVVQTDRLHSSGGAASLHLPGGVRAHVGGGCGDRVHGDSRVRHEIQTHAPPGACLG